MTSKLLPYGEVRNATIVAKIGEDVSKSRGRVVGGKVVTGIERLSADKR